MIEEGDLIIDTWSHKTLVVTKIDKEGRKHLDENSGEKFGIVPEITFERRIREGRYNKVEENKLEIPDIEDLLPDGSVIEE